MDNKNIPDLRPIQVFLDTKRFIELEQHSFFGGAKDFFEGNDKGFIEHRTAVQNRVNSVAQGMRQKKQPGGIIKVRQRKEALAKSHRPLGHLFTGPNSFALVGTESGGELLFQTTPAALDRLSHIIETKAEDQPRLVKNKKTGKDELRVSGYRSEVGGVEDIQLYDATDKIRFSADEAIEWMKQPNVIGGYIVKLFKPDVHIGGQEVHQLITDFKKGVESLSGGILVRSFLPSNPTVLYGEPSLAISVQLLTNPDRRLIELPFLVDGRAMEMVESSLPGDMRGQQNDLNSSRHTKLLTFLSEQALVRTVELPPILETLPVVGTDSLGPAVVPDPFEDADYPIVAIVDGGVADNSPLRRWKIGDAGLVPASDRDEAHGTFIAGLVTAGNILNPVLNNAVEPGGCKFFDLDLFPRRELRGQYYPDLEDLFDTLDEKVKVAKRDHSVRVFNLSFAIGTRSSRLAYSLAADRLDRIARSNDVIFVVAAGNLRPGICRPPWPIKAADAVSMLAAFGTHDQQITAPSEHILGITVGAINPHGVAGHEPSMPTTYTRRGPGVGGARKPDLAHYGGADSTGNTGLKSIMPSGETAYSCGTSFAAPLNAATIATLDQRLARRSSRETLLALPIHRARRPEALEKPELVHISREYVGFGVPPIADSLLNDEPHSVTLVFSDRLLNKQKLDFPFSWPKSLVNENNGCRGKAEVTLCYTPPIDPDHGEEAIRVQLEATLHQETLNKESGELFWESRLKHDSSDLPRSMSKAESYLVRTGLKWSPIKRYYVSMKKGRGNTSNWRLSLEGLVRAAAKFPADGIPFTLILTIIDSSGTASVREQMRQDLQSRGLVLADITVAHQIRTRSR